MSLNDFILSDKRSHRIARHSAFWMLYACCYFLQSIPAGSFHEVISAASLTHALISVACFIPACFISVLFFSKVLLPFLQRKKYVSLVSFFILFAAFLLIFDYYATWIFYRLSCNCKPGPIPFVQGINLDYLGLAYINTSFAISISLVAFGIKLAKNWYLQQKENLELAKEKVKNDLYFLKTKIEPTFLFQTMDILKRKIRTRSQQSPQLVLKLSDLMSYILYECSEDTVPVENELFALQNFIAIEQIKRDKQLVIHTKVKGDTNNLYITPMILLPLLQNILDRADYTECIVIYLQIQITDNELSFRLSRHYTAGVNIINNQWTATIEQVRSRLNAFYTGYYFFEVMDEEQGTVVTLQLKLQYRGLDLSGILQTETKPSFSL